MRGVLALAAAAIGLTSVADTLANVITKVDPARAHVLSPEDGHITADLAEQQFTLQPSGDPDTRAAQLARLALQQDATAVEALSVLGLQAQMRQDIDQARQVFTYSQALSRRELRPRIWAIEEAVSRGDIAGALEQYDIALRTSRSAQDILFPVLASAITEPLVRAELIKDLAQETSWGESFIRYIPANATDPRSVMRLFQEAEGRNLAIGDAQRAALVNSLAAKEFWADAWSYYQSFRTGADRRRSRDSNFSTTTSAPSFFDWAVITEGGRSASIQEGLVDFSVAPSTGGVLLQQMQMLPPGTYRLEGRSSGIEQPERSLPYWGLTCRDGRELGRVSLSSSAQGSAPFTGRFVVPSDCPVQTLSLVARPSDEVTGVTGQISQARLRPVSGNRGGGGR